MKIFKDFDVYTFKYGYDDMKVMYMLAEEDTDDLDYEDLMRIATKVWDCWAEVAECDAVLERHPFLKVRTGEYGYIQLYAQRVLPELIKIYKEEMRNDQ